MNRALERVLANLTKYLSIVLAENIPFSWYMIIAKDGSLHNVYTCRIAQQTFTDLVSISFSLYIKMYRKFTDCISFDFEELA